MVDKAALLTSERARRAYYFCIISAVRAANRHLKMPRIGSAILRILTSLLNVSPDLRHRFRGHMEDMLKQAGFHVVRIGSWGQLIGIWSAIPVSADTPMVGI